MTPEATILLINLVIVLIAYLFVYPRMAGYDMKKVAINDVLATGLALLVAGSLYMGSGVEFRALSFSFNWFWFSLLSYFAIEIPFMVWYFRRLLQPPA
jgi:hypothetical protein